ncbi:MAG: OsmC family protein [Xanthomonadales bacterium]|nr:OsmC family protein [Xanthomonadales bacterium]
MQEKRNFDNARGDTLAAVLHRPDAGPVRACAVFAHCFTCTKNVKAAVIIARALAEEGIAVLRFDFTGLGQSEGEFESTHFSSNVQDLVDAAAHLEAEFEAPALLVGHSLGGTAVLAAAHQLDSVRAVATIGSPADAEHVLHLLGSDLETIESEGDAEVELAGRPFRIRRDFVEDVRSQSVRDGIRELRRALLIMHSPVDELVPVEEAARIYTSALHPKSFVSLDDADHLLSREADARYAANVLAAWAARYLGEQLVAPPAASHEPGSVSVAARAEHGFLCSVNADGHLLIADEPSSHGGSDRGPTPYDFLAAALGTCTAMTLNMYARRKEWVLEQVDVAVSHDRVHAKDCEDCDSEDGQVHLLRRRIGLRGELDEAQRSRLLEIADKCPVHKTLEGEIKVRSELA